MATKPDAPDLEEYSAPVDEPVVVATAEFGNIFGGCAECQGWATVEQLRSRSKQVLPPELPPNLVVTCVHWCHDDGPVI